MYNSCVNSCIYCILCLYQQRQKQADMLRAMLNKVVCFYPKTVSGFAVKWENRDFIKIPAVMKG